MKIAFSEIKNVSVHNVVRENNRDAKAELCFDFGDSILSLLLIFPDLFMNRQNTSVEWSRFNEYMKSADVDFVSVSRLSGNSLWFIEIWQYDKEVVNITYKIVCQDIDIGGLSWQQR
jgi:hypothetical protein